MKISAPTRKHLLFKNLLNSFKSLSSTYWFSYLTQVDIDEVDIMYII